MCYAPVEEPEISWSFVCLFVFIFSAVAMLDLLERGGEGGGAVMLHRNIFKYRDSEVALISHLRSVLCLIPASFFFVEAINKYAVM